ncbi:hypothetical protein Tco_1016876 [Tanacetum coccineum]|uniref:Uncharacterized protein n=1 Tax=Tanacetum coccineum TaxID=301880 RepID=A0ABQ5FPW3_9ASTR
MNTLAQQTALDNALVSPDNQVKIGKCNMRIIPTMTKKEPTYQVVLYALALSPLYTALLITTEKVQRTWLKCGVLSGFTGKPAHNRNTSAARKENMPYLRFTKAIISKDKSISMRNKLFMHTVQHDSILGYLKFVSKTDDYQAYGALIPTEMTNLKMQNSLAYKTFLAYATGAIPPKKSRKFKKPGSSSKKKTLVVVEELAEKLAKKPAARRQSTGVQIRDTPGGSSEGAGLESEVPDEPKGKSIDTSEGTGLKPWVLDVSRADSYKSEYESWGDSDDDDDQQGDDERTKSDNDKAVDLNKTYDDEEDEFIHTLDDYVPTDDEHIDNEEYDRINDEMYSDVNVELKDKEIKGDQVKDDALATFTVAPATQKTEVPLQSSSISSDCAAKFINFDNIPSPDTEIISLMEIKVQHEDPKSEVKTLKNVNLSLAVHATIKSEVLTIVKEYLGTSLDDTLHKVIQRHTAELIKEYSIPADSILEDEDAMDKGVADKSKKRKPDDADRDEGPPTRSNQGLKRKKTSKDAELSKKAKST